MRLAEIAKALDAESVVGAACLERTAQVAGVFDSVSALLISGEQGMLLLTPLATPPVVRAAHLVGACAVVILSGVPPSQHAALLADELGLPILVTACTQEEACARLRALGLADVAERGDPSRLLGGE